MLILVIFSTLVPSFSAMHRRAPTILRTQDRHPTPTTPGRGRPVPAAPCRRYQVYCGFCEGIGRVCFCHWSSAEAPAGGATETFFFSFDFCSKCPFRTKRCRMLYVNLEYLVRSAGAWCSNSSPSSSSSSSSSF